jgi:hypothetical protein
VPASITVVAEDHDVHHKGLLTPSVYLECDVPFSVDKSFCTGQVTVVVNDNVLQPSSPIRHAAAMVAMLRCRWSENAPPMLLKFSDGGTDQRNTLESVKCSLIAVFKLLNLDMIVAARCAPGQSWINTAERVMSILNIALQNCALERPCCTEVTEGAIARCNGMQSLREAAADNDGLRQEWAAAVGFVQDIVASRFRRLALKDQPIKTMEPVTPVQIAELNTCLNTLFPGIDLSKLNKKGLEKNENYRQWILKHCRERTYTFQLKKCDDLHCCSPYRMNKEDCIWIPDPELYTAVPGSSDIHYKKFEEIFGQDTTEKDKPSQRPLQKSRQKVASARQQETSVVDMDPASLVHAEEKDASIFTVQCARSLVTCIECRKPRCVYSKHRLTERQSWSLTLLLSEVEYSCGDIITAPGHALHKTVLTRTPLSCADHVEIPYYSTGYGRADICCHCAIEDVTLDDSLLKKFKTVLPMCADCSRRGCAVVCQRPYGKAP